MRPKKVGLYPLLVILAVALVSVLFVVSCGGAGEATEAAQAPGATEDTAAVQAAAAQATAEAEAAEHAALVEFSEEALEVPEEVEGPEAVAEAALVEEEGAPKRGGTLKIAIIADHNTLDPPIHLSTFDIVITQQLYDNLLMIQPDLSVKPELATSWEPSEDLSSYTFHLREGVKFHHGKEFKAEDVVFSFNRLLDPVIDSPARSTLEVIKEMVVIDDYTIRFDLTAPNAFFPTYMSIYQARILPSDVDIERLTLEEFGTGPFVIEEHLPGERTTMVRYDDYWEEGKPYLDEIVLLAIPEPATRDEALKSGDVDVVYELTTQSVPAIEAHPDTTVLKATSWSWIGLVMDNARPPFDNKLVRQAFQAATDREAINQVATFGLGIPAFDHPIHPAHPVFSKQYAPPDYDPELARSLLEQAGYPDGIDVDLHTADIGSGMIELAVAFKESAAPAGIRINVQRHPSDGFWDVVWMEETFTIDRWYGRNPDQALSLEYCVTCAWNAPHYYNQALDDLVVKARGQKLEDQKKTYEEIQRILIDDVPQIVVAFQPWLYGVRNNVRGADPHPLGWGIFQDAWLDD